jgi:diguanylate cyclase (GGDEF)-like protein
VRRRLGIFGASDEALQLIGLLTGSPRVEVVRVFAPDGEAAVERAARRSPELCDFLLLVATDDAAAFRGSDDLSVVVDATPDGQFQRSDPDAARRGVQVVTPRAARLLWGYGRNASDRKAELLQVLSEMVESVELSIDSHELFTRMLEIAIDITGADGGSLMLLEPGGEALRIRVAVGVERELWPKIRVPLGVGVAGRAAADRKALRVDGPADQQRFRIAHERLDVESALCVPLVDEGRLLGVLNLHHSRQREVFNDDDLAFVEQLALLDAQIIGRAEEHASLRDQAARYSAVREVNAILAQPVPLAARLGALCRFAAESAGDGIAHLYLREGGGNDLVLEASSIGAAPADRRLRVGQGVEGRVAETGRPGFLRSDDGELEVAALPLCAGDRVLGVLSVQSSAAPALAGAARGRLLEIATAAAASLAQVGREERISERANRLSAINETGIRMLSASELAEVAGLATSSLAMILGAEHVVLRLLDEDSGRFVIRSYFGPADEAQQEALFGLDKPISVRAIQERETILVSELDEQPELAGHAGVCRSLVVVPLLQDGGVVGTLAAYDKLEGDRFFASRFDEDDVEVLSRFVSYVERAVSSARDRSLARQQRNFDPETGLPNENYLDRRVHEEIARAEDREAALTLCICSIENLDAIAAEAGPEQARVVVQRVAGALRRHLRDFDVVGRRGEDAFEILLPDPGASPGDRVYGIARAVADEIAKDEALREPERVALGIGYAIHPYDGADRESLLATATPPRIRMV